MALTKGTNAYVTVAEAAAYMADKLDTAAWVDATPEAQAQAIVTATRILDDLSWTGLTISEAQPLAFPRQGEYFDPRLGKSISLPTTVPNRITQACIELAYHLLNNDGLLDDTGSVKNIGLDVINLTNVLNANVLPASVKRMIKPLQVNQGGSLWWRAN